MKEAIASATTLIVAGLGYRQWLRGRRSGHYQAEAERAYKEVWASLEDANLFVRRGDYTRDAFKERVRAANALIMQHGLYFEAEDRPLVTRYLNAIDQVGQILTSDEAAEVFRDLRAGMSLTADPIDLQDLVPEYREALSTLEASRQVVVQAFRRRIGREYA
jgi:hypothetical protein